MKKSKKPDTGIVRYCGEMIVADIFGYLVVGAIPHELISTDIPYFEMICAIFVPLASALGI
jgi:hypothetical protein